MLTSKVVIIKRTSKFTLIFCSPNLFGTTKRVSVLPDVCSNPCFGREPAGVGIPQRRTGNVVKVGSLAGNEVHWSLSVGSGLNYFVVFEM